MDEQASNLVWFWKRHPILIRLTQLTAMDLNAVWTGGHSQTILCVGVNADGCVASGGEGGEVCLWNPDGKVNSKKSFPSKTDVNSVCFSPGQPSMLYVSVGDIIELLDIRCPESSMAKFAYNDEDINQLALDSKETFLAACDDDGVLKIIDLRNRKVFRTLKAHSNICASAVFHPTAQREIASGGLDCFVHTWEITRGSPRASVNLQDVMLTGGDEGTPSPYMINPPFVHSVDFSSDGDLLASGMENARVQLLERKGRRELLLGASLEGHSRGVTQVSFVPNSPGQVRNLLLTAGNDCKLLLWDIAHSTSKDGPEVDKPTATEKSRITRIPKDQHISKSSSQSKSPDRTEKVSKGTSNDADVSTSNSKIKKKPRLSTKHKDKINWIAPVTSSGGVNMVFVADVSENISVYQWELA